MQLLAGFFLDHLGIALQSPDLLRRAVVFLLQPVNFFLQALIFRFLLAINDHAVGTEHHVCKEPDGEHDHSPGRQAASNTVKNGRGRPRFFFQAIYPSLGLRSAFDQAAQPVFRTRQDSKLRHGFYMEIHDSAAALACCRVAYWIQLQLSSEMLRCLLRQAEVFALPLKRTNFDKCAAQTGEGERHPPASTTMKNRERLTYDREESRNDHRRLGG